MPEMTPAELAAYQREYSAHLDALAARERADRVNRDPGDRLTVMGYEREIARLRAKQLTKAA